MSRVNVRLYRSAIRQVWSDGVLTKKEDASLQNLRRQLNIPEEVHDQLLIEHGEEIYKNALWWAWEDGKMEPHESAELARLRSQLQIEEEQHEKLEEIVRREIAKLDREKPPMPSKDWSLEGVLPGYRVVEVEQRDGDSMSVPEGAKPLAWEETLQLGSAMYQSKNFERAIAFFDRTLSENPNCGKAQFFRKKSQFRLRSSKKKKTDPEALSKAQACMYWKVPLDVGEPSEKGEFAEAMTEAADTATDTATDAGTEMVAAGDGDGVDDGEAVVTKRPFSICISCGGEGNCAWCKGSGECSWCHGSGQCAMCRGSGKGVDGTPCKSCQGTGECSSCKGRGKCYWCDGTGRCSRCQVVASD